jgi:hypothetical protein
MSGSIEVSESITYMTNGYGPEVPGDRNRWRTLVVPV